MPFTKGHPFYKGGEKSWFKKGTKLSEEVRRKISETRKRLGLKPPSPRGRKITEETREKLRQAQRGRAGKPLTEEQKKYLSEFWKGKQKSKQHAENIRLSKIGSKNPMYGRKYSMSLTTKQKISASNKGEKNGQWRGGINPEDQKIRGSLEYRLWRESVFKRDNYTCVWCGKRGGRLNADHIKPFCDYPELRFAIDNGRTLCEGCHRKTDTYGGRSRKKCQDIKDFNILI